jgi:uncharacterized protein
MTEALPMFPLGMVLFPHAVLPLHVFEPRYQELTEQCLAADGEFGVVLIERGSEVGGGDTRFDIGTVARIVRAGRADNGRWALLTVGVQRFRVDTWLEDDPYPRAHASRLDDASASSDAAALLPTITSQLRRVFALRAELGDPIPPDLTVELSDDPVQASYEASAIAPIGPLDAQRLLEVDDPGARLAHLETLLGDEAAMLELRLAQG